MANLKLTLPDNIAVCDGKQVTFKAPCNCADITNIIIRDVSYELRDSKNCIPRDAWVEGALVTVVLDCTNGYAYVQAGSGSDIPAQDTPPENSDLWIDTSEEGIQGADIPITDEIPEDADLWIDPSDDPESGAPAIHASNHAKGGKDPITPEMIGAFPSTASADYKGCYYRELDGIIEWINPPFLVDTEYRTIERHFGKPVYKKWIYCGVLAKSTNTEFVHNIANIDQVVGFGGKWDNRALPAVESDVNSYVKVSNVTRAKAFFEITTSNTVVPTYLYMEYTKTTDEAV